MNDADNPQFDPMSEPDSAVSPAELQAIRSALRDIEPVDALTRRRVLRAALAAFDDAGLDAGVAAAADAAVAAQPTPLRRPRQRWYQKTALLGAAAAVVVVALVVATSGDGSRDDAASDKLPADELTVEAGAAAEPAADAAADGVAESVPFDATTDAAGSDTSTAAELSDQATSANAAEATAVVETQDATPPAAGGAPAASTTGGGSLGSAPLPDPASDRFDGVDLGDLGTFSDPASLVTTLVRRLDASSPTALTTGPAHATTTTSAANAERADEAFCSIPDTGSLAASTRARARARVDGVVVQVTVVGEGSDRIVIGLDAATCTVVFELAAPVRP